MMIKTIFARFNETYPSAAMQIIHNRKSSGSLSASHAIYDVEILPPFFWDLRSTMPKASPINPHHNPTMIPSFPIPYLFYPHLSVLVQCPIDIPQVFIRDY